MRRRELLGTFLAGTGLPLLAGCSGGGGGSGDGTPSLPEPTPGGTTPGTPTPTATATGTATPIAEADGFQLLAIHVPDRIETGQEFTWGFTVRNTRDVDRTFSTDIVLTLGGLQRNIGAVEFSVAAGSTHRFSSYPISFDEPTTMVVHLVTFDADLTIEVGT